MFTRCGSAKIFKCITNYTSRIASSNFYHTALEKLKHTFCMFFFLISCFCENGSNLFVAFFFSCTCEISVTHSSL